MSGTTASGKRVVFGLLRRRKAAASPRRTFYDDGLLIVAVVLGVHLKGVFFPKIAAGSHCGIGFHKEHPPVQKDHRAGLNFQLYDTDTMCRLTSLELKRDRHEKTPSF